MYATLTLSVMLSAACAAAVDKEPWTYDGRFHKVIANADRIVVRETWKDGDTLFEVTTPSEIQEVREQILFQSPQEPLSSCFCGGYPVIEWYKGNDLLAYASVQHGVALRWQGFPGDARLTKKSSEWMSNWLAKHIGFDPYADPAKVQAAVEKEARQTLQRLVPAGFLEAAGKGAAEFQRQIKVVDLATLSSVKPEDEIKADYIRAAVRDKDALFLSLFRLLGCLPMRWEMMYRPEQQEAYEFLVSATPKELDQALRSAARSTDAAVRQGAARLVFLESNRWTGDELERWREMLAGIAYADVIPHNRRLVVRCLASHPKTKVMDILERAAEDSDGAVRREAINALQARGSPEAAQILRRIVAGKTQPRKRPNLPLPKDYSPGVGASMSIRQLLWEPEPDGTDREAAAKSLQALGRPAKAPSD